jgi:hypothetical protein
MPNRGTRTGAFRTYGVELSNRNFSISGTSFENKVVAVSLWLDELGGSEGQHFYDRSSWADWNKRAKQSFFNDLSWARDNLAGIVRVVISVRDGNALGAVRTSDCYARPDLLMKIVQMDPKIGSFRLEEVDPALHSPFQQPASADGEENHSSPSLSFGEKVGSFTE